MNPIVPNLREDATKLISPKGTTTLFVTNMSKGNLMVPKSIQWDQVNLPESWILEEAVPPKKKNLHRYSQLWKPKEERFDRSRSFARSRGSFSGVSIQSEPIPPRFSISNVEPLIRSNSVIGVQRTEEQVAQPVYERPQSPTPSDMGL